MTDPLQQAIRLEDALEALGDLASVYASKHGGTGYYGVAISEAMQSLRALPPVTELAQGTTCSCGGRGIGYYHYKSDTHEPILSATSEREPVECPADHGYEAAARGVVVNSGTETLVGAKFSAHCAAHPLT
jgi:hypothetical protein